jgi:ribonuclease HI
MTSMKLMRIYTDGSCIVKRKSGGWCFLGVFGDKILTKNSGWLRGTNNEAELRAFVHSLEWVASDSPRECVVEFYIDSSYVLKHLYSFTLERSDDVKLLGMIDSDQRNLGLTGIISHPNRTPNYYQELWKKVTPLLRELTKNHTMYFWWLRGHLPDSHPHGRYHNQVDRQASVEAKANVPQT